MDEITTTTITSEQTKININNSELSIKETKHIEIKTNSKTIIESSEIIENNIIVDNILREKQLNTVEESIKTPVDSVESNFDSNSSVNNDLDVSKPQNNKIKHKKRFNCIDSDSDDDITSSDNLKNDSESEKENVTPNNVVSPEKKKSRLKQLIDSDSDEEIISNTAENADETKNITHNNEISPEKKKSRLKQLIDSDSEEENIEAIQNAAETENIFDEEEIAREQAKKLKNLCDSESSAEENDENIPQKPVKSKAKLEKSNEKKMTGRDAVEQRRQIKSESQKIVRESRVSLPYHRPKQHTLRDFLKRRSQLDDVIKVPPNTPTTFAIKMSSEQLLITAERLKQREKEIEKFYKSDESEEEIEETIEEKSNNQENEAEKDQNNEQQPEQHQQPEQEQQTEQQESVDTPGEQNESTKPNEIEESTLNVEPSEDGKEEQIKELREVLQKFSCGNDAPMEQLMEQPIMEVQPEEPAPEELSEQFIDNHFTGNMQTTSQQLEVTKKSPEIETELEKKIKKLNPIVSLKKDFHPRLSGGGSDLIVLDEGVEKSKGVTNLMKRFFLHTSKKQPKNKPETPKSDTTAQDIILIEDEVDDEPAKKIQTPGLKFKKLRAELEEQIAKKRSEEWKKRQLEKQLENEEIDIYAGEKTDCGAANEEIVDLEDEEELSDEETSSEDDEIEDDIDLTDKPQKKSAFLDNEAEVSEDEDDGDADDNDIEENDASSESEQEENDAIETIKKPLKRIIQNLEDSDEDSNKIDEMFEQTQNNSAELEDDIPAYQMHQNALEKTPLRPMTQNKNDLTTILTPTFHLTALQGMESTSKSLNESPGIHVALSPDPSPIRSNTIFKTKLFSETDDQNQIDELENLCSGKFSAPTQNSNNLSTQENNLLNICSGKFTDLTNTSNNLTFENDSEKTQQQNTIPIKYQKLHVPKFTIISSSDEENTDVSENTQNKTKKIKKKKRKYIIDDISISDEDDENDTANLNDFNTEDSEQDEEPEENENINYDSEENEIEIDKIDEIATKKAREFFEAEAELSGSDWGSADEDEKDLDNFEEEDGDEEKINEKRLQRELGRMHAHTVLEEDKRDIRLLQELLLEDGEMHGAGREKKFKWKNADSLTWNDENKPKDDDEDFEETENELEWRKMRHEREMFLKEQQLKLAKQQLEEEELLSNDSQIMQLGQKALKNSQSQQRTPVAETIAKTNDIKLPFSLTNKRGSFLMRSETTLARLAELTRTTNNLNSGPKNSRNFIFQSVEKTETIVIETSNEKKRKAIEGTPKPIKKLRIHDLSPGVQKLKKKPVN